MALTAREVHILKHFHIPVLEEFFNRIVDAYPRTPDGHLGTIQDSSDRIDKQMEMAIVHNLATFPINCQRYFEEDVVLTQRFRDNVELVVNTFLSHVPDNATRDTLKEQMQCPAGGTVPEKDLTFASNSQLWAAQFVRLVTHIECSVDDGAAIDDHDYDLCTIQWMCTSFTDLLSVNVESGPALAMLIESLGAQLHF
ncbi:hypothetical protein VNI00_013387 [Paramarasmius palmivorus]|uniref:Uncharacterized protein n=1 Tax=Paramarasmius palmivorus TaxID=297713 RepID=A0AAW0BZW2_9AGAR